MNIGLKKMKKLFVAACFAAIASSGQAMPDKEVICSYAPSQSAVVGGIFGAAGGAAATTVAIAQATGMTVVTHSSGAYILTGAGGYIAGTLGAAIAAPVIVGVSLLVGGTAVTVELLCAPRNHPKFSAKVKDASVEFGRRSRDYLKSAKTKVADMKSEAGPVVTKSTVVVKDVASKVFDYAYRSSRV